VAIRPIMTARWFTSAGRFSPFGPFAILMSSMLSGNLLKTQETVLLAKDENLPEIIFKDGIIAISSIVPISAETIQEWNLQPGHTVSIKFTTALLAAKLAEFFEKQGAPAKDETSFDWATKIVTALGEQGLRGAALVDVNIHLKE
jgi:hypothetical protein